MRIRAFIPLLTAGVLAQFLPAALETTAQSSAAAAELRVSGAVSTPLVLTVADLKKMPRRTLSVVNPHNKKTERYEVCFLKKSYAEPESRKGNN